MSFVQVEEKTEEIGLLLSISKFSKKLLLLLFIFFLSQEVQKEKEEEAEEVRAGKQTPSQSLLTGEQEE